MPVSSFLFLCNKKNINLLPFFGKNSLFSRATALNLLFIIVFKIRVNSLIELVDWKSCSDPIQFT